jgi:hypothetical protein
MYRGFFNDGKARPERDAGYAILCRGQEWVETILRLHITDFMAVAEQFYLTFLL